jgi:hypothetical protein
MPRSMIGSLVFSLAKIVFDKPSLATPRAITSGSSCFLAPEDTVRQEKSDEPSQPLQNSPPAQTRPCDSRHGSPGWQVFKGIVGYGHYIASLQPAPGQSEAFLIDCEIARSIVTTVRMRQL